MLRLGPLRFGNDDLLELDPVGWQGRRIALLLGCSVLPAVAQPDPAQQSTRFDCVIEPRQVVKLASSVVGVIARLDVDRGDVVAKGQVLGKLEDGVEEAMLALARAKASNEHAIRAAQARLEFLRAKQGRTGQLVARNFAFQASAEEARAEAGLQKLSSTRPS